MHVMIRGNWANYVGTDYCYYLGEYESLDAAAEDAKCVAYENWEPDEETDFDDEGPDDYWVEEYNPDEHDGLKAGGGEWDFSRPEMT